MRWIDIAISISLKSKHPKYKMGAVLIKGGSIISGACNGSTLGKHAEVRAISLAKKTDGCTIYVARSDKGISKPCSHCLYAIQEAGIRYVVYLDQLGKIQKVKSDRVPEPIKDGYKCL